MAKLSWWVPRWSYARRYVRENWRAIRSLSYVRILFWSTVVFAAICAGFKWKYPELDLHFLWKAPFAIAGIFVYLGFVTGVHVLIPPTVSVSSERIHYAHGDSGWIARREECSRVTLWVFSTKYRRLVFWYKNRRRAIGIAESVELDALQVHLPYPVKRVDAQRRFRALHSKSASEVG